MNRRQFLGSAVLAVAALAGCRTTSNLATLEKLADEPADEHSTDESFSKIYEQKIDNIHYLRFFGEGELNLADPNMKWTLEISKREIDETYMVELHAVNEALDPISRNGPSAKFFIRNKQAVYLQQTKLQDIYEREFKGKDMVVYEKGVYHLLTHLKPLIDVNMRDMI